MSESLTLRNYTRRPFSVDAIRVTEENIEKVAELCRGRVLITYDKPQILVPVKRPSTPKQAVASVGDWVVYHQRGWKVYPDAAFRRTFQATTEVSNDLAGFAAREAGH